MAEREDLADLETTALLGLETKGTDVQLRQRQRMGSDMSSFSRAGSISDEELDSLPTLYQQERLETGVHSSSNSCAMTCFFFSLAGVVFLSTIAFLLGSNSLYFKVSKQNEHQKPKLVEGVLGAASMYLACAVLSGWYWYRSCVIIPPSSYHVSVD